MTKKKDDKVINYKIKKTNGKYIYRNSNQLTEEYKKIYESRGWKVEKVEVSE